MNDNKKKIIGRIIVAFVVIMLFFTFFSNTINNFSLAAVTTDKAANGSLVKNISASGKAAQTSTIDLYTDTPRKVSQINVNVGDTVKKGQVLIVLDSTDLQTQLTSENSTLAQKQASLSKLQSAVPGFVLNLDQNIENAREKMVDSKNKLNLVNTNYSAGKATSDDVTTAQNTYNLAAANYNILVQSRQKSIDSNNRDISNAQNDVSNELNKIALIKDQINNKSTITASDDGVVQAVNVTLYSTTTTGKPAVSLVNSSQGYTVTLTIDTTLTQYLKVAADINTSNDTTKKNIRAKVTSISDNLQQKGVKSDVVLSLTTDAASIGDTLSININNRTKAYQDLVPNEAVHTNSDGSYIYVLKQKSGPLGNQYFASEAQVTIDDYDGTKSAVTNGISPMDQIIVSSDKSLSDGDQVRLSN